MARSIVSQDNEAVLYIHFPCFDGIVSGVLAVLFLRESRGWQFKEIHPVNYGQQQEWLHRVLPRRSAVVDFLYHPQADFWADHHPTTFLTESARADYERSERTSFLYGPQSGSCAMLLWHSVGGAFHGDGRLREMVEWADKIDSAAFSSVEEALSSSHPALILSRSLAIDADDQYCAFLITRLQHESLAQVAESDEVRRRFLKATGLVEAGLQRVGETLRLEGQTAVYEASSDGVLINRYAPYYFHPQARYSIGVTSSPDGTKITAMRNPWVEFESVNLGQFMRQFGGGGHQRVGSLMLPKEREAEARSVVTSLLQELTSPHLLAKR